MEHLFRLNRMFTVLGLTYYFTLVSYRFKVYHIKKQLKGSGGQITKQIGKITK